MNDITASSREAPVPAAKRNVLLRFLAVLGPGLVTGAADDDPSGIGTYSQVGAQFGYQMGWSVLFSYPLMVAIQEVAARIGSTTGHGIAANLRKHYPLWVLEVVILALLVANVINLGADIAAMGDAAALILPGPMQVWVVAITVVSVSAQILLSYARYAAILKWATLVLFAYVATVIVAHVHWSEALVGALVPIMTSGGAAATALVAVLGTTISPYLFFWQSSQEVEELQRRNHKPLCVAPRAAGPELRRIRVDTLVGMAFSNIISIFIIVAVAATLYAHGIRKIETSVQAAQALAPIAGKFASVVFAAGIVGTGLLALPVLAGSAAYGVCEAFRWRIGLDRKPMAARAFYGVIAGATLLGVLIAFSPINPMKALYWSAVVNGVLAAPLMVVMMLIASNGKIMGKLVISWRMRIVGWFATAVMAAAAVGMFVTA
jgi:NRAMP (natural resistance-associated macrophage protein)-like metal ion transporter